ncbi:TIGR01777 family oxidoreductase [Hamadaea tsunoensis]|uniref:TIGR01777 family oxidoreductase n=1 Tax=Hamadaea tsunoensis TaxID=53368 RepID=UPI00041CD186|nr:TIGR01777 family oxidoreductase [Hamadaea tsunoensis]
MRIVAAGASGFLGQPLIARLRAAGHEVIQLVRRPATASGQLSWDPARPLRLPEDTDAVVNIGGAGVGDHRWSEAYKRELWTSRVQPTETIARAVAEQGVPVLLNGSAIGYYGDRGEEALPEDAAPGDEFLSRLAIAWEEAAEPARTAARVAILRTGLPFDRSGGMLKPLMLPFSLGLGGRFGDGRAWMPWISLSDWLRAVEFLLTGEVDGPVNLVGPTPATNADFARELAAVLHRPALLPIPRSPVRLAMGEFADEAYKSFKVIPAVLEQAGFVWEHPTIGAALRAAVKR